MGDSDSRQPQTFSQLAELHVAGLFAEAGWLVYFPHRDEGFDFIAMRDLGDQSLIRPVQVKGRYPTGAKLDRPSIGFIGELTKLHPEMVLAIAYFDVSEIPVIRHVAFMPQSMFKPDKRGIRCLPAKFQQGMVIPRGDHAKFFDHEGLRRVADPNWKSSVLEGYADRPSVEDDERSGEP
ncbi:MAG: hypothetical protein WCA44_15960 [Acidobacteriaceae bacterium]|jgi:hypothetical protein